MKQRNPDTPGVIAPPPLILLATLVAGLALHFAFPVRFLPVGWMQLAIGLPLIAVALLFAASLFRTMRQAGEHPDPSQPTTTLITHGPFRFSRNPGYLSMIVLYIGIADSVNALWLAILLPLFIALISLGVINREEGYLQQKLGQEYMRYKAKVRRWL